MMIANTHEALLDALKLHNACDQGSRFARRCRTPAEAWKKCKDPSWMFWALSQLGYVAPQACVSAALQVASQKVGKVPLLDFVPLNNAQSVVYNALQGNYVEARKCARSINWLNPYDRIGTDGWVCTIQHEMLSVVTLIKEQLDGMNITSLQQVCSNVIHAHGTYHRMVGVKKWMQEQEKFRSQVAGILRLKLGNPFLSKAKR